jgi:hypothetical protein
VQELLESASLDRGSQASLRRALELSTTAGAFARQAEEAPAPPAVVSLPRAIAKWVVLGAAAGGILALGTSRLLAPPHHRSSADGELAVQPPAASAAASPDIAAEPLFPASAAPPAASLGTAAEARELEVVRSAMRRGDYAHALETLNAHDQAHPHGTFAAQSLALRIVALKSSGRAEEAKTLTREFQKKFPNRSLDGDGSQAPKDGSALDEKK